MPSANNTTQPAILSSWKEIACYLGKGVRTVQRWEKNDHLPVHRIAGTSKIVAYRDELDRWLRDQPAQNSDNYCDALSRSFKHIHRNVETGAELRNRNAVLLECVSAAMRQLMDECTRAWTSAVARAQVPGRAAVESQEATNEEVQPANEEIQSGNEELQSTNGELQASNEALQSANEELRTMNELMQQRNRLLSDLNNELTNLLNSVNLPLVMVGPDLSVRRFTPQAARILGLVESDVGRPIPRLKLNIEIEDLEQAILDVVGDVRPKQFEVKDNEGNWCSFRLAPFRAVDQRIDGVVLSIVTLDERSNN